MNNTRLSQRKLAEVYKVNRETIKKYMNKLGIKDTKEASEEEYNDLIDMIEELSESKDKNQEEREELISELVKYQDIYFNCLTKNSIKINHDKKERLEYIYDFMLEEIGYSIGMLQILRKNKEDIQKHAYYKRQLKEDLKALREIQQDLDKANFKYIDSKLLKDEDYIDACLKDDFTEYIENHKNDN